MGAGCTNAHLIPENNDNLVLAILNQIEQINPSVIECCHQLEIIIQAQEEMASELQQVIDGMPAMRPNLRSRMDTVKRLHRNPNQ